MTPEQMMAVETKVANDGKSPLLAFVIWFFLGWLGAHRFYLNKEGGAFQALGGFGALIMTIVAASNHKAYVLAIFGGVIFLAIAIWVIVDAFFILGWVKHSNNILREEIMKSLGLETTVEKNTPSNYMTGDINDDAYKIFLTKKFNIEFNQALNKYIVGDKLLNNMEEALVYADEINKNQIEIEKANKQPKDLSRDEFLASKGIDSEKFQIALNNNKPVKAIDNIITCNLCETKNWHLKTECKNCGLPIILEKYYRKSSFKL